MARVSSLLDSAVAAAAVPRTRQWSAAIVDRGSTTMAVIDMVDAEAATKEAEIHLRFGLVIILDQEVETEDPQGVSKRRQGINSHRLHR